MNSLNPIANNTFKNTYDVTSKQYSSDYIPYNSEQDLSSKDMQERLSKSPPIIICQIGDRENPRTHRHHYLFYPSATRLSPYSENNSISNFNIVNQSNSRGLSNNFDLEKEVNKLRDENRLIKEEYQRRMNDNNMNSNNREKVPEGNINYIKNKGEYLNLIKNDNNRRNNEEEKMERGPSGNYNNKDQEYDRFVNNQKNLFKTDTDNNNINRNTDDGNNYYLSYGGNNYNNRPNLGTLDNRNNPETGMGSGNYNNTNRGFNFNENGPNNRSNNFNPNTVYNDRNSIYSRQNNTNFENNNFNNSQGNNRGYNNRNNNNDTYSNNRNNNNDTYSNNRNNNNDNYSNNRNNNYDNYSNNRNINNDNYSNNRNNNNDTYSNNRNNNYDNNNMKSYHDKNDIYIRQNNNTNNETGFRDNNNNTYNNRENDQGYYDRNNDNQNYRNNNYTSGDFTRNEYQNNNNQDSRNPSNYVNNNRINPNEENNNRRTNYDNNNSNNKMYSNSNPNENNPNTRKKVIRAGYGDDKGNNFQEDEKDKIRTDNNTRKDFENDGFERGRGNSTMPIPNNLGIDYSLKNATDPIINSKISFGRTDNNFNLDNEDNNNYYSSNSKSNPNNNIINNNTKDNNNDNTNTNNNMLRNQFQNSGNNDMEQNNRENKNNNEIEANGEDELVLVDKNNKKIISDGQKQFKGEQAQEVNLEGDQTIVKTKDGRTIKLEILRNIEGEIIGDEYGNPLLGKDNIYFIDRNGNPIVLLRKMEGDRVVPVIVKKIPYDPFSLTTQTLYGFNSANDLPNVHRTFGSNITGVSNNKNFGYETVGLGTGYSELKKRTVSKNRTRLLNRGDGDAKAPIKKKRRKKSTKK